MKDQGGEVHKKTAQAEWGYSGKLLDDVTYSVLAKEEEIFQASELPEVKFPLIFCIGDW